MAKTFIPKDFVSPKDAKLQAQIEAAKLNRRPGDKSMHEGKRGTVRTDN